MVNCDIRLASDDARFCVPLTRWGFLYPYEGVRRFVEVLGPSHATSLLLLGETVTAGRAYEMGLVHRVVAHRQFEVETEAIVGSLVQSAAMAVRETKTLLRRARWDMRPSDAFLDEVYLRIAACLSSHDTRERRRIGAKRPRGDS